MLVKATKRGRKDIGIIILVQRAQLCEINIWGVPIVSFEIITD